MTRWFFLRQVKKLNLPKAELIRFYHDVIECIISSSVTVWHTARHKQDKHWLQRMICWAERIISCKLLLFDHLLSSRAKRHAGKIISNPSHPGHMLFELPPSGERRRKKVNPPVVTEIASLHKQLSGCKTEPLVTSPWWFKWWLNDTQCLHLSLLQMSCILSHLT